MDLNNYVNKYYNKKLRFKHPVSVITDVYQDITFNGVFVSIKGKNELIYIKKAIENGAKTIFIEHPLKIDNKNINIIVVPSTKMELARLLKEENKEFLRKPKFIGITGTNGKTTTTYLLYSYLKKLNYDILLIGTNWIYSYVKLNEVFEETNNTTPSLSLLYKYLRMYHNEYDYVIMEVSSQGIEEGRLAGIKFDIVGITNLSSEHLDYHHTLSEYKIVKGKLLNYLKEDSAQSVIILNQDDLYYDYYKSQSIGPLLTFGINCGNVTVKNLVSSKSGLFFIIKDCNKEMKVECNLIGQFNVYNILMLYAINKSLKINNLYLENFLKGNLFIPGRMNIFKILGRTIIVDFAHTISAVENVLISINKIKRFSKVYCVIGCGGNRDKSKRPIIGNIVTSLSDYVIFTEDNSRDENTTDIIEDITTSLDKSKYNVILDRQEAIKTIFKLSHEEDIILVLGKGAETYQIKKNNIKVKYSDIDVIRNLENDY